MRSLMVFERSPADGITILIDFYTDTVILDDYRAKWYIWLYITYKCQMIKK
jgi:hypothetical protein